MKKIIKLGSDTVIGYINNSVNKDFDGFNILEKRNP